MQSLKNNTGIIVSIIIFVAAIWIYKSFFGSTDVITLDTSGQVMGSDILQLNSNLQTVTLDKTLFGTTAYKSLVDFSTTVPQQPIGRSNPFAALGGDSSPTVKTQ